MELYFEEIPLEDESLHHNLNASAHSAVPTPRNFSIQELETCSRPGKRGGCTLTKIGNNIFMIGGANREAEHFGDVYAFNLETKSWNELRCRGAFAARSGHSAVAVDHSIYVFGGLNIRTGKLFNEVISLNTVSMTWTAIKALGDVPSPRNSHSAIITQDVSGEVAMLIFGGSSPDEGPMNDVYLFHLEGFRWERIQCNGDIPQARELHASCVSPNGRTMFVFGGRNIDGNVLSDMQILDLRSNKWTRAVSASLGRCSHVMSLVSRENHSALLVFGGWNGQGEFLQDLWIFDTLTEVWMPVSFEGQVPEKRFAHASIVANNCMYIFGGMNASSDLNDMHIITQLEC